MRDRDFYLCRKHSALLLWAAFSTLLDLSGKLYDREARRVFANARCCVKCHYPRMRIPRQPQ